MSDTFDPCYGCGKDDVCHFLTILDKTNARNDLVITLCDDCHNNNLDNIKDDLAWEELARSVLKE